MDGQRTLLNRKHYPVIDELEKIHRGTGAGDRRPQPLSAAVSRIRRARGSSRGAHPRLGDDRGHGLGSNRPGGLGRRDEIYRRSPPYAAFC